MQKKNAKLATAKNAFAKKSSRKPRGKALPKRSEMGTKEDAAWFNEGIDAPETKVVVDQVDAGGGILVDIVDTPKRTKIEGKPIKTGKAKAGKKAAAKVEAKPEKKLSLLSAAAQVLAGLPKGGTLNCQGIVDAVVAQGLWSSPAGKTPAATLSAAINGEIKKKGEASRFTKAAAGQYAAA